MKNILRLITITLGAMLIITYTVTSYAVDRFVDIPVPPNSAGKADFTSEEGEKEAEQYEENKIKEEEQNINNANKTEQEKIEKSGNNYLKSLNVEGYKLEPEFNKLQDEYTLYVPNIENIKSVKIIAEPDDKKAQIEGTGDVEITSENNIISINVIAENGNLKVYTINVKNQVEKPQKEGNNIMITISTVAVIAVILGIGIIASKKSKKS